MAGESKRGLARPPRRGLRQRDRQRQSVSVSEALVFEALVDVSGNMQQQGVFKVCMCVSACSGRGMDRDH